MISEKERLQALQVIKAIRENDNGKVTSFIKKGWAKLLYNHKTYLQIEPKKAGIPNAIETALFNSNFDILKKMKKDGLNFDEFELLRTCCQCNDSYNEANFLIKNGANINFAKQNSSPPLYTAVVNNRDDLVKLFIVR
jgi:ankyrin repeat protein